MKKLLSVILCLSMIICFAACGSSEDNAQQESTKSYEAGSYTFELPDTYELNDLKEVKAEDDCIAMLSDKEGTLPDLWIYEDKCEGSSIKEHIMSIDKTWNFTELSVYEKDGSQVAAAKFDEDWYGTDLVNEAYYRLEDNSKVLTFDFAYETSADQESMHSGIVTIAESLGF